ncbi:N-acetyl-gamma-glutamyl-phosphate reductase [Hydrogenivirga caldilitoris]|uniref:N-acetyl-gamma-glutamyl-phosphate reductase n=1 Tax=Hydrogenivirga caldilitoris TaxID=246264 RepID=A0A497XTE9_9AQUI|nr:N-acetyl-gamma-glutamyl-phosphate reductase [Hydrogenivirga caldilitoris]RLJ71440.1 N-acetyl-gamma-glutamyl-phosphate reductase [Hydrogenivirga caldilitoris]
MEQTLRVCIYGATGYTASELIRILVEHPYVRITDLVSSSTAGRKVSEVLPHLTPKLGDLVLSKEPEEDFDLAFLCLPHEVSLETVPELLSKGKKVVDLSGAYRIRNPKAYEEFYGFVHRYEDVLETAVYGLPEFFRESIKGAQLVANPGCYPTATLLALYPLIKEKVEFDSVIVHALSGVSGAGRGLRQQFHYPEMEENFFAYSVEKHRHTPEMEDVVKRLSGREMRIRFTPVVVPASRGMLSTLYVRTNIKDIEDLYRETYSGEPFITISRTPPMTKWVLGTNNCILYPTYDARSSTAIILSALDNLGKGASSQAVQNMNLMFGLEETLSLPTVPKFP